MSITAVMEDLRRAVLDGDFAALNAIADRLNAACQGLSTLDRDELEAIRRAAEGNARRLEAALQGVRSARRRLAAIADAERSLTYDSSGAKTGLPQSGSGLRV